MPTEVSHPADSNNCKVDPSQKPEKPDAARRHGVAQRVRALLLVVGIDKAVGFTVLARGWGAVSLLLTTVLITRFTTLAEQGIYYGFGSLVGLQVVVEMGLSYVICQFASHERAKLELSETGLLQGDVHAKSRVASLLRMSVARYAVMSAVLFCTIMPVGLSFFGRHISPSDHINWQLPWVWLATVSSLMILLFPILSTIEGCGFIAETAQCRFMQSIVPALATFIALACHAKLYALPIASTCLLIYFVLWIVITKGRFVADLWSSYGGASMSWKEEVWPFQWRIALSSLSAYFIFQLFTPLTISFQGKEAGGRIGLTVSLMLGIASLGAAWVNTKFVIFGQFIARRQFAELDKLYSVVLRQSVLVVAAAGAFSWLLVTVLSVTHSHYSSRILDPLTVAIFVLAAILNQVTATQAAYLRAHKQDPLVNMSIIVAAAVVISDFALGAKFGPLGMAIGYLIGSGILGCVVSSYVFVIKRREWHGPNR